MKIQLRNKLLAYLCLVIITISNAHAQSKEIQVNTPLPQEFASQTSEIYLNPTVEYIISKKLIYSTSWPLVLTPAINTQISKKQELIAKEEVFKNDTVILPAMVFEEYKDYFNSNDIVFASEKAQSKYTMSINIYEHGFHWATSSAAGMFVRTKIELTNTSGEIVWEQYSNMSKTEKKIPHNRKAINMYMAIDKLIADYKTDPALLETTYKQIVGFLPSKLIPETN